MDIDTAEKEVSSTLAPAAAWPFPSRETSPTVEEAAPITRCSFIMIPQTHLPNGHVEPAFQVGQYLVGRGPDEQLEITASGIPLVDINYNDARTVCAELGGALITETQALVIAYLIAQVTENYTNGVLMQGLHSDLGDWDAPLAANVDPEDAGECRAFLLPDGSVIFDAAGNAYTWVFDNVQGNADGIVAKAFAEDSPSITTAPHPSCANGVGFYPSAGTDWSSLALVRGGYWYSGGSAGVFFLHRGSPVGGGGYVGVRCTKPVGV